MRPDLVYSQRKPANELPTETVVFRPGECRVVDDDEVIPLRGERIVGRGDVAMNTCYWLPRNPTKEELKLVMWVSQ